MRRSLFGAHLDDFSIDFYAKEGEEGAKEGNRSQKNFKARRFASRGQQKLVIFLLKIALAQQLEKEQMQVTLLLDDFLTDFDHKRLSECLMLLSSLSCQVFITCPLRSLITQHYTDDKNLMQIISLWLPATSHFFPEIMDFFKQARIMMILHYYSPFHRVIHVAWWICFEGGGGPLKARSAAFFRLNRLFRRKSRLFLENISQIIYLKKKSIFTWKNRLFEKYLILLVSKLS